jgi:hypothetical protein
MYEFPNASTTERVNQIFKELEASDESTITADCKIVRPPSYNFAICCKGL